MNDFPGMVKMVKFKNMSVLPLSLLLASQACGKKIEDSSASNDSNQNQSQYATTEDIVLSATNDQEANRKPGSKTISRHGMARIPKSLKVTEGNGGSYWAKLTFNKDSEGFEFYCLYKSGSSVPAPSIDSNEYEKGMSYDFKGCFNEDNLEFALDDVDNYSAPIYEKKKIELQLLGSHPDYFTSVEAQLIVEWN